MAEIHDGDVFNLCPGANPIYAEFLETNGRLGWRLVDKYGHGILLEATAMARFSVLIGIALKEQSLNSLDDFGKANR